MSEKNWKWFGHAAHFICGHSCRFHLATLVGKYLVSTVGELWPERDSREVHARVYDPKWLEENRSLKGYTFDRAYMERFGFEDVGYQRKYETMVFKVTGKICKRKGCNCGLPEIVPSELDFGAYNDAGAATRGHTQLCQKWSAKR